MNIKHCTRCGYGCPDEALFCSQCGNALHRADQDPLIGQTVAGRYYLVERIGQGGAGTLYRAEHVTLRRRMAVKLLHHQLSINEEAVERFRREAITVCEIDNDHILQVHDFGRSDDGRLFFAMEYLEGEPLSALLLREGPLPIDRCCDILSQLADALMEAHALGYVHRDLRPRNVFLTRRRGRNDFVKLLDFGLAKLVLPDVDAAKTNMGMTFGDPHYMAPEQARGEVVDRRADIYSLGAIAYEILVGEQPYKGSGTFDILGKVLDAPVPRIRDKREDCPEWLEAVVRVALAKSPVDRFATVAQLLEALERKQLLERQPPFGLQVTPPKERMTAIDQLTPMRAQSLAASAQEPQRGVTRAYEAVKIDNPPAQPPAQEPDMRTSQPGARLSRRERRQLELERRSQERPTRMETRPVSSEAPDPNDMREISGPRSGDLNDKRAREIAARELAERAANEAAEAEARQRAEEALRREAEARRKAEEAATRQRAEQEARRKAEEEAQRKADQERRKAEEAAAKLQAKKAAEEEARRRADQEERRRAEEATAKLKAEQDARRKAEEAKQKAAEEARQQKAEQERRKAEEAAKKKAEQEARKQAEQEARKRAEEETRKRAEDETRKRAEEQARQKAEEARRKAEAEEARRKVEAEEARRKEEAEIEQRARAAAERAREIASRATLPGVVQAAQDATGSAPTHEVPREPTAPMTTNRRAFDANAIAKEAAAWEEAAQQLLTVQEGVGATQLPSGQAPDPASAQAETHQYPESHPTEDSETDEDATRPTPLILAIDEAAAAEPETRVNRERTAPLISVSSLPVEEAASQKQPPARQTGEHESLWFDTDVAAPAAMAATPVFHDDQEFAARSRRPAQIGIGVAVALGLGIMGLLVFSLRNHTGGEATTLAADLRTPEAPKLEVAAVPKTEPPAEVKTPPAPEVKTPAPEVQAQPAPEVKTPPAEVKAQPVPEVKAPPPPVKEATPTPVKQEAPAREVVPVPKKELLAQKAAPEKSEKKAPKAQEPPVKRVSAPVEVAPRQEPVKGKEKIKELAHKQPEASPEPVAEPKTEKKPGESVEMHVQLGRQRLRSGEVSEAAASFAKAHELDPKNADALAGLGEVAFEQGNWEEAIRHLRQGIRLAPRRTSYQVLLGQSLYKLGRYKDAAETCKKVLKQDASLKEAQQILDLSEKKLAESSDSL